MPMWIAALFAAGTDIDPNKNPNDDDTLNNAPIEGRLPQFVTGVHFPQGRAPSGIKDGSEGA